MRTHRIRLGTVVLASGATLMAGAAAGAATPSGTSAGPDDPGRHQGQGGDGHRRSGQRPQRGDRQGQRRQGPRREPGGSGLVPGRRHRAAATAQHQPCRVTRRCSRRRTTSGRSSAATASTCWCCPPPASPPARTAPRRPPSRTSPRTPPRRRRGSRRPTRPCCSHSSATSTARSAPPPTRPTAWRRRCSPSRRRSGTPTTTCWPRRGPPCRRRAPRWPRVAPTSSRLCRTCRAPAGRLHHRLTPERAGPAAVMRVTTAASPCWRSTRWPPWSGAPPGTRRTRPAPTGRSPRRCRST